MEMNFSMVTIAAGRFLTAWWRPLPWE